MPMNYKMKRNCQEMVNNKKEEIKIKRTST